MEGGGALTNFETDEFMMLIYVYKQHTIKAEIVIQGRIGLVLWQERAGKASKIYLCMFYTSWYTRVLG